MAGFNFWCDYADCLSYRAIWTFGDEIKAAIYGTIPVHTKDRAVVLPSVIQHKYPGEPINTVFYKAGLPVEVIVKKWGNNPLLLHLDPYSGKIMISMLVKFWACQEKSLLFLLLSLVHHFQ